MKYRCMATLYFLDEQTAIDFWQSLRDKFALSVNIGTDTSKAAIHECHHDETPPEPCDVVFVEWENPNPPV